MIQSSLLISVACMQCIAWGTGLWGGQYAGAILHKIME